MSHKMVLLTSVAGQLQAEIIRGLLGSMQIPTEFSQETAGTAIGLTVGPLGLVDILVPEEMEADARATLRAMENGELETGGVMPDNIEAVDDADLQEDQDDKES